MPKAPTIIVQMQQAGSMFHTSNSEQLLTVNASYSTAHFSVSN